MSELCLWAPQTEGSRAFALAKSAGVHVYTASQRVEAPQDRHQPCKVLRPPRNSLRSKVNLLVFWAPKWPSALVLCLAFNGGYNLESHHKIKDVSNLTAFSVHFGHGQFMHQHFFFFFCVSTMEEWMKSVYVLKIDALTYEDTVFSRLLVCTKTS